MSTSQAIEAVTLALRNLLSPVTATVTARPLDRARYGTAGQQLNLFLYDVTPNAAMRNLEPPSTRGSTGLHPPLALDLRYLLTAYGDTEEDATAHRLLGQAMLLLHDDPILLPARLEGVLAAAEVHLQCERVRLSPVHLSTEEVSKLWTAFQTNFRLSVAYQASVVLIDTAATGRAALPVLRRGRRPVDSQGNDGGVPVTSGSAPRLDRLWVEAWRGNPSMPARTGDRLVLEGAHLGGDVVHAVFRHPRLAQGPLAVPVAADESTDERVVVALPDGVPAGFATVGLRIGGPAAPPLTSNALGVPIAPRISSVRIGPRTADTVEIAVACDRVVDDQSAVLLLGTRQVAARVPVREGVDLAFLVDRLPAAPTTVTVRVRIDGVDSVPLPDPDPSAPPPSAFDPAQEVTLP